MSICSCGSSYVHLDRQLLISTPPNRQTCQSGNTTLCLQYVWWTPLPYLLIPQHLNLHVVLGVQKDPDGQLRFTYQEDHIFWVESLLGSNPILTLGLGPFFMTYVRPLAGKCTDKLDGLILQSQHRHSQVSCSLQLPETGLRYTHDST